MAATAFQLYGKAKPKLLDGTFDLDTNVLKARLYKTASNCSSGINTISLFASINNPVTNTQYTNGKTLGSLTVKASGNNAVFDAADLVFTASASSIISIKFLAIGVSGGHALCFSKLTATAFTLAQGNTLTIQFNAAGIFVLS